LEDAFCLLVFPEEGGEQDVSLAQFFGMTKARFLDLTVGPCVLLNLSYSIRQPLLDRFSLRKLCSLDPTEVCFWMQRMEMGQSFHEEFWSIGLNMYGPGSRVPDSPVRWQTYFPLVDTAQFEAAPRPSEDRFTTIGQWYWDGMIEWDGQWRDFSKKAAFGKFLSLPGLCPEVRFELAMNLMPNDPEKERVEQLGWHHVVPHCVARTPQRYYDYLRSSTAEFSAVKLESFAMSGWLSDRSAVYLALGRPVISEPTGAEDYLPGQSGLFFVRDAGEAAEAVNQIRGDWNRLSRAARRCARECFDSVANLKKILG